MRISTLLSFLLGTSSFFRFGVDDDGSGDGGAAAAAAVAAAAAKGSTSKAETFSREYVQELREENKAGRLSNAELKAALKEHADKLTAAETTANERVTAATKAADDRVLRAELKAIAVKHGLVDMDGLKLLDLSAVKLLENGDVEGADALFEAAKKAKPYLFTAVAVGTTARTPAAKQGEPENVREMSREDYAKAKKAASKR